MAYKHDYDKALTRLVSILTKLYNGEQLSVKDLAEEFNVSTRTIQRDFNDRLISFPIYQENRLWKMQDGFRLEKSSSIEDSIILDIIEKLVEGLGNKFSSKAKTLLSKIKNEDYHPIYTKLNIEDISDKLNIIQQLEIAIKEKKEITCKYNIKENKTYDLLLKPLKVANYEGFWYLIALDINNKNTLKKYYLKSILNINISSNIFTVELKLEELLSNSISVWFQQDVEAYEVKIHVNNIVSKYVKRKPIAPTQIIESIYDDGSMDIVVKITHEMEIMPLIKYWVPYMKVLEPAWIKDRIKEDLEKYIKTY